MRSTHGGSFDGKRLRLYQHIFLFSDSILLREVFSLNILHLFVLLFLITQHVALGNWRILWNIGKQSDMRTPLFTSINVLILLIWAGIIKRIMELQ